MRLRQLYDGSNVLKAVDEDGSDGIALVPNVSETFIDVHDSKNVYTGIFLQQVSILSKCKEWCLVVATDAKRQFSRCSCLPRWFLWTVVGIAAMQWQSQ